MKRSVLLLASAMIVALLGPTSAQGAHTVGTFLLVMEAPNIAVAPNGDHVSVTGEGEFTTSPMSVEASGEFAYFDADGNQVGGGTWTATQLISFDFYGCRFIPAIGADLGSDDLCGGALKMAALLDTPIGQFPAILTVFCIIGTLAPASHNEPSGEGVTLNVPSVINFNHTVGGENVYIRTS
jgi:hypothetical protein